MKKKGLCLLAILCLLSLSLIKAQDTLFLNDGTEMHVKIFEIKEKNIIYKKSENLNGPTYSIEISKVFMAVYKGGTREFFQTMADFPQNIENADLPNDISYSLNNQTFEVQLTETKNIPDKQKMAIIISATIEVYSQEKLFTKVYLTAYQKAFKAFNNEKLNARYLSNNNIIFSLQSEKLKNILFQKYESESGKGVGWALPPNFFALNSLNCSVFFLEQKKGNKEVLGFGGYSSTKFDLQDCSSLENKFLSIALLWLETNFGKNN